MNIVTYPDPVLKTKTAPVKVFNKELFNIVRNMIQVMYKLNGVGLAANQVGISHRISVINPTRNKADELVLINPKLTRFSLETVIEDEGCLSLPGLSVLITRHKGVTCEYYNLKGERQLLEASGLLAKIIQHEVDHLNGILCIDRLSGH